MKTAVLLLILPLALFGQRFVSGNELEGRLLTPQNERVLHTPDCLGSPGQVKLLATVDRDGRVTGVKPAPIRSTAAGQTQSRVRRLIDQAKALVLRWRYRPMLVAGQPIRVRTMVSVPCQQ